MHGPAQPTVNLGCAEFPRGIFPKIWLLWSKGKVVGWTGSCHLRETQREGAKEREREREHEEKRESEGNVF